MASLVQGSSEVSALLEGYSLVSEISVLWGDEDSFAHVNNVAYLRWCESARVDYLRRIGLFPELPPRGIGPIVARVSCDYRRPMTYPDTVLVGTRVTEVGNSSFRMEQRLVSRALGETVAEADAVMVAVDYAAGNSVRVPEAVREAIRQLDGAGVLFK